jgi:hypothetical protein
MKKYVILTAILLPLISECHAVRISARLTDNDPSDSREFQVCLPNGTRKIIGKPDGNGRISIDENYSPAFKKDDVNHIIQTAPGSADELIQSLTVSEDHPGNFEALKLVLSPSDDKGTLGYASTYETLYHRPKISVRFKEWCPLTRGIEVELPSGTKKYFSPPTARDAWTADTTILIDFHPDSFQEGEVIKYKVFSLFSTFSSTGLTNISASGSLPVDSVATLGCTGIVLNFSPDKAHSENSTCAHPKSVCHPYDCTPEIRYN